jgi:RNA polymerase sigma-70 factor (ECF subfamily)
MSFRSLAPDVEARILADVRGAPARRDAAVSEVFRAFREPVLALCLHLTGRRADAEDVLQEVFLSVHRALPLFRGESRLSTWIYRIAVRASLEHRSRRRLTESLDPDMAGPSEEDGHVARDRARRLLAAMERLSVEHRTALSLFAVEGLSHKEISDILGVPEGTVWSRLNAARKRVSEEMGSPARR